MLFEEKYKDAISFLLEKGNIAISYCTLKNLHDNLDINKIEQTKSELVENERAKMLLDCMKNRKEYLWNRLCCRKLT